MMKNNEIHLIISCGKCIYNISEDDWNNFYLNNKEIVKLDSSIFYAFINLYKKYFGVNLLKEFQHKNIIIYNLLKLI